MAWMCDQYFGHTPLSPCSSSVSHAGGPTSPIEVHSCDLCILDLVGDSLQVTCMTTDDWCHAHRADPSWAL